jgi:hypothetical protein
VNDVLAEACEATVWNEEDFMEAVADTLECRRSLEEEDEEGRRSKRSSGLAVRGRLWPSTLREEREASAMVSRWEGERGVMEG